MTEPRYLAISGGVGGAKLCLGLSTLLGPDELDMVVNTGDDFRHLGLHISPDIDTLVYTLSGQANADSGWGRRGESWNFLEALGELGGETWFRLGDKDMAMHIERTRRLRAGASLSEVTADLARALGIRHRILPMSDDRVRTRVRTEAGWLDFQHYFVRERCEPPVTGFGFKGAARAAIGPPVQRCLESDGLAGIIVCPSNPYLSIDPILALPGLRESLANCAAPVIAVSPVVGGAAIKGPTVKIMRELGIPHTAGSVARHYADFLDGFVLDRKDRAANAEVAAMGLATTVTQTVMDSLDDRISLARDCLDFIAELS